MKFSNKKKVTINEIDYERALETPKNIFFVNFKQPNNIGSILMLDRKMNVQDNSFLAFNTFETIKSQKLYNWVSEKMKKYLQEK